MDWNKLISKQRLCADGVVRDRPGRTEFEADVDRVLFSSSFRRLGRKTQVHPLVANDHVHTRLTHSLEVGRVGNALGKALGKRLIAEKCIGVVPDDIGTIVQAACLAHDLGNPPFGHAGENAIVHWFRRNNALRNIKDLSAHEGNAQGFRIVTQLENNIFSGGLRLTYATLAAFQKYPWIRDDVGEGGKFGCYVSEKEILDEVFKELGVAFKEGRWCRHPLAYLVEAADDICYCVADLEDAVELRILNFEKVSEVFCRVLTSAEIDELKLVNSEAHRINFARIRGPLFDKIIQGAIDAFMANYDSIMSGVHSKSLFEMLPEDDLRRKFIEEAMSLTKKSVFSDSKKVEIEIGCYSTLDALLGQFCDAALEKWKVLNGDKATLEWKASRVIDLLGDHAPNADNGPKGGWTEYDCVRRVIDFVNGMTDGYAVYIAKQLQGAGFSGIQRP